MRKLICIVTACFMIIFMFSGCGVLQKLGLQKGTDDELRPVSSIVMNEDEAKKLTDKVPVHLYFANEDNSKLKMEVRYIPVAEAKKSVNNLATLIVKELIKGPSNNIAGLKPTIPAGAQLKTPVSINARVATVDFSKEFVDKHPGGKAAEQMTIYSVVNSLTELKDIEKVRFTINGKAQKEFKGSFVFDSPFPKSTSLISKETAAPKPATDSKPGDSKSPQTDKNKSVNPKQDKGTQKNSTDEKAKSSNADTAGDDSVPSSADLDEEAEGVYMETLE